MPPLVEYNDLFARGECTAVQCLDVNGKVGVSICLIVVIGGGAIICYYLYFRDHGDAPPDESSGLELVRRRRHDKVPSRREVANDTTDVVINVGDTPILRLDSWDLRRSSTIIFNVNVQAPDRESTRAVSAPRRLHRAEVEDVSEPTLVASPDPAVDVQQPEELSVPGPPSALPTPPPTPFVPGHVQFLHLPAVQNGQLYSPVPSPGYATTLLSDAGSEDDEPKKTEPEQSRSKPYPHRDQIKSPANPEVRPRSPAPLVASHGQKGPQVRIPSATTIDTESKEAWEKLHSMRVISDSINSYDLSMFGRAMGHGPLETLARIPSGTTATTESTQVARRIYSNSLSSEFGPPSKRIVPVTPRARPRNPLKVHTSADQSRIGRPKESHSGCSRSASRKNTREVSEVAESRVGRGQLEASRARAASSRPNVGLHTPNTDPRGRRTTRGEEQEPRRSKSVMGHVFSPFGFRQTTRSQSEPRESHGRACRAESAERHSPAHISEISQIRGNDQDAPKRRRSQSRVRHTQLSELISSSGVSSESSQIGGVAQSASRGRRRDPNDYRHPPRARTGLERFLEVGESRVSRQPREESRRRESSRRGDQRQHDTHAEESRVGGRSRDSSRRREESQHVFPSQRRESTEPDTTTHSATIEPTFQRRRRESVRSHGQGQNATPVHASQTRARSRDHSRCRGTSQDCTPTERAHAPNFGSPKYPDYYDTASAGKTPASTGTQPQFQRRRRAALQIISGSPGQLPGSNGSRPSTAGAICSFGGSHESTTCNDSQAALPVPPPHGSTPSTAVPKDTTDGRAT